MSQTRFSLLLPVYHRDNPAHFELALRSATLEQTLKPAEIVLVQDGPVPDALADLLENAASVTQIPVKQVILAENQGLGVALQKGLEAATYDVVARMDADDVCLPERFAKQIALIDDGFDLVGAGMAEFVDDPSLTGKTRILPGGAQIHDHARWHSPFNHPTVVYRRDAVQRAGGYQPFGTMEDYWLWARMLADGAKSENIQEPLVLYRIGTGVFKRRGGFAQLKTEVRLQFALRRIGIISTKECARNICTKGVYRLLPAALKKLIFRAFVK